LRQRVGRGGMAFVFSAWDAHLQREVAVKIIKPELAKNPDLCRLFHHEAQITASLQHPHIIPIYDFNDSDGLPYIVMPLIQGKSLKQILSAGRLPLKPAREIFLQTCDAIGYAHQQGIAHGDIKPANILISPNHHVFVTDFGLAAMDGKASVHYPWGSPRFSAPEQAAGLPPTPTSDVYSLGLLLHLLLASELPTQGSSGLSQKFTNEISRILVNALADQPADRFPDANQLFAACAAIPARWPETFSISPSDVHQLQ